MPYNFAADSLHTKELCSRLSSSEVRFLGKSAEMPKCTILSQKVKKNFWGGGTAPSSGPTPIGQLFFSQFSHWL